MESLAPSFPSESDSADEVQRLIGEVAKRHQKMLGPEDPVFLVLTLLELVAGRYLEKTETMLQAQREGSMEAMERSAASAKTVAEQLITAAAEYVAQTSRSSIGELTDALTRAAAAERAKVELASKEARRLIWVGSTVLTAVIAILIGIAVGNWLGPSAPDHLLRCPSFTAPQPPSSSKLACECSDHSTRVSLRNFREPEYRPPSRARPPIWQFGWGKPSEPGKTDG